MSNLHGTLRMPTPKVPMRQMLRLRVRMLRITRSLVGRVMNRPVATPRLTDAPPRRLRVRLAPAPRQPHSNRDDHLAQHLLPRRVERAVPLVQLTPPPHLRHPPPFSSL